jgi:hypothetical protein
LLPASRTESVLVTAETPLLEATKTDVSTVINNRDVANLPTTTSYQDFGGVANDYLGLVAFAPGLKYDYTGSSFDIVGPGNVNDHGININEDGGNISDQVISARDCLRSMEERLRVLGGHLEVRSQPTEGTRIDAWLPLQRDGRHAA